ncbi:MAG: hypothetical protein M0R80_03715 [Proteobacteria bacterium]|jgi:hypothetical protein|nr:hypothetical protein [Pseudomonadota bacterium]
MSKEIRSWFIDKMAKEIATNKNGEYHLCYMREAAKLNIDFESFFEIIRGFILDKSIWNEIRSRSGCANTNFSFEMSDHGCRDPNFNGYKSKVDSGIIKDDFSWMVTEDREKYLRGD